MPGNPSVPRRVDSSLTLGFSGREIGADTRSVHKRMGDYLARMGAFLSDPSEVSWYLGGPVHPAGVHTSVGRHNSWFAESIARILARVTTEKQADAMEHMSYLARNVLRYEPVVELR